MKSILSQDSVVHFNKECYPVLNKHIAVSNYSSIIIITDTNTFEYCYPYFIQHLVTDINIEVVQIDAGEEYKNIETCTGVWNALSDLNIDRKCLIINLGGGVVTDLGGFIACTYKRGVKYINIPTSLLAMVDASVGGKTGVDLGSLKNQIGVISTPEMVLIDTAYLNTLPQNQMRSGLAEILKHGLIQDQNYWKKASNLSQLSTEDLDSLIYDSVVIKNNVVTQDPTEEGIRKTLNFGHTLGHAIESYFLEQKSKKELLHGEAIAIGIILASYISTKITNFDINKCLEIKESILNIFPKITIEDKDIPPILELMKFDKKNSHGNINFVLLKDIGETIIDIEVPNNIIYDAFTYYKS
ncbi:3-dehydroquinate synthase [Pseudofulvibacter geojedonensis]|uniref:3-dehydroquinate synthase n=1 Tax=Pseudofulvibacter geojedonensis TaxID=1123758 RepID=A0ABW3I2V8_9FLAO